MACPISLFFNGYTDIFLFMVRFQTFNLQYEEDAEVVSKQNFGSYDTEYEGASRAKRTSPPPRNMQEQYRTGCRDEGVRRAAGRRVGFGTYLHMSRH